MTLRVQGSFARRSGFTALFDLELPLTGVTAVLGASGAGKSTLLRCIAGLEYSPDLAIYLDDVCWQGQGTTLPGHQRPVSLVFQDGRLFPHLSVRDNLQFPLRLAAREGVQLSFDAVVDTLALAELLDRRPGTLSGGQRQRAALGRALLAPARLWLFDEPLSSLDGPARQEIAPYLARICRDHAVPILYVTHALDEVHHLASRVVVLSAGKIVANQTIDAAGALTPIESHERGGAVLRGRCVAYRPEFDLSELAVGSHHLYVTGHVTDGAQVSVLVAARDVSIALHDITDVSIQNRLPGRITGLADDGPGSCVVTLDCDGQPLAARITRLSRQQLGLAPGQRVVALIKSVALAGVTP
jgi:molybdate transport system ATP-binding protein